MTEKEDDERRRPQPVERHDRPDQGNAWPGQVHIPRRQSMDRWRAQPHDDHGLYGAGQEDSSRQALFEIDNDEPAVLLGQDKGANPTEFCCTLWPGV